MSSEVVTELESSPYPVKLKHIQENTVNRITVIYINTLLGDKTYVMLVMYFYIYCYIF